MLYGAYLARRFWTMFGAPTGVEAQAYEQMQTTIEQLAEAQDLRGTAGGAPAQTLAYQQWAGRGAYQTFGGLAEGAQGQLMSTGDVGARLWATGRVALGVGAAGMMLGGPMGAMFGAPAAMTTAISALGGLTGAAALGLGAAAAITGVGIGVEVGNIIGEATQPNWITQKLTDLPRTLARLTTMSNLLMGDRGTVNMLNDPNSIYRNYIMGPTAIPGAEALRASSQDISQQTGVPEDTIAKLQKRMAGLIGTEYGAPSYAVVPQLAATTANEATAQGIDPLQWAQQKQVYAEGLGLTPGRSMFRNAMEAYGGMSITERYLADQRNAVNARYAGEISPYFSTQMDAVNFAWLHVHRPDLHARRPPHH
jgi:hypothetical protein